MRSVYILYIPLVNINGKWYITRAKLAYAAIAQLVERAHGKGEVRGSNPRGSSL